MKKALVLAIIAFLGLAATAQVQPQRPAAISTHTPPPPERYTISFTSQHGESFTVYIDGEPQNRMPQSRVTVNNVGGQTHEVIVVMKRPVDRAATLMLRPGEPNVTVNVSYDSKLEKLYLYTAGHNRPEELAPRVPRPQVVQKPQKSLPQVKEKKPAPMHGVTDDELNAMAARMKAQSFDSDRLALGKVIVASSNLTAAQIAYLARTIDFSNSQVEFLKHAYAFCIDPQNYYTTVEVLTFSSDKQKVLDYIATQQ